MDASCDLESKACTLAASNEGLACEDGDLCTLDQTCAAGSCVGGSLVDCSGVDSSCGLGVCDAQTGELRRAAAARPRGHGVRRRVRVHARRRVPRRAVRGRRAGLPVVRGLHRARSRDWTIDADWQIGPA
jgi:hypothetical protein